MTKNYPFRATSLLALGLLAALWEGPPVRAGLLFDNSVQGASVALNVRSGFGLLTPITVSNALTVTSFEVLTKFPDPAEVDFVIANHTTGQILYQSGAISFGASSTLAFVSSPTLSFALAAGGSYDIGLITILSNPGDYYSFTEGGGPFTQNGITASTTVEDQYTWSIGGTPSYVISVGASATAIQIYGFPSSVPEPPSFALCGLSMTVLGLGYARSHLQRRWRRVSPVV